MDTLRLLLPSLALATLCTACNREPATTAPNASATSPTTAATAAASAASVASSAPPAAAAAPAPGTQPVNLDNYARAESDEAFAGSVKIGGFGKFSHNRELTPLDKQIVIRQNRDTLYSSAVFDLDAGPVTIVLPDPGTRFMSMQVFDEDQYTHQVAYKPGTYKLDRKGIGTRYAMVALRILVDPNDPRDLDAVHALQDQARAEQPGGPGKFEVPNWDPASRTKIRDALAVLGDTLPDKSRMFGMPKDVDPMRRLIGVATGWGGNPEKEAMYLGYTPTQNDGRTVYRLKVGKDVPVDGFWSVTVYNAKGYFEANPQNAYSFNNLTAKKDADGGVTLQFGGCDGKVPNCLPITPGWNYLVRLYRPRAEVLNHAWKFPEATPVG